MKEVLVIKHEEFLVKGHLFPKLERMLVGNIRDALEKEGVEAELKHERGRIYIYGDIKNALNVLKRIPGVAKIGKAFEFKSYEGMKEGITQLLDKEKIYKIEVKRADKEFPRTSIEIAQDIAKHIESKGFKTGVRYFDKIINIEIRKRRVVVLIDEERGIGGFPQGFEGKAIILFSGGFDSVYSTFLAIRQGIKPILLLVSPSYEITNRVKGIVKELEKKYFCKLELVEVNLPSKIFKIDEELRQIAFKRFLYLLADKFSKDKRANAIITGEVIGQTHTQRISNIKLLERNINTPFIRPISLMSKNDIINQVKRIGLYDEVKNIPEFCSLSKRVKIYPSKEDMERIEGEIKKMVEEAKRGYVKIDGKKEGERIKINLEDKEMLSKVINHELDKNKKYLLLCKTGTTAKMLAEELRRHGYDAIGDSY